MPKTVNLLDMNVKPSKAILNLAGPAVAEQILLTMMQYVNAAMLGFVGTEAAAAVTVSTTLIALINGITNAVAIGFSVQAARYIGSGDTEQAKKIIRQAVLTIFVFGGLVTLVTEIVSGMLPGMMGAQQNIIPDAVIYLRIVAAFFIFNTAMLMCSVILRCAGDTRTPLIYNTLANVVNAGLNFFLIFPTRELNVFGATFTMWGADLGVTGAAVSTAVSTVVAGMMLLASVFNKKLPIGLTVRGDYRPDGFILKDTVRLGLPSAFESGLLNFGQIVYVSVVTGIGTTQLAAHFMANTAEAIVYLPVFGLSTAAMTLAAQLLGADKKELAYKYARLCGIYGMIAMTVTGGLMFIFSSQLMGLFTPDPAVIAMGSTVLKIEALAEPLFAYFIIYAAVFRGAGDTRFPFYTTVIGMWVVRMPLTFLLVHVFHMGLTGAWIPMALDLAVRGAICLVRFRRGKWMHVWKNKGADEPCADGDSAS